MTGISQAQSISQSVATSPPPPPPPPQLSPVEQGDVAAGRARVVEGQVFQFCANGQPCDVPATADWGRQPVGSGYREAFDQAAARLGTTDPATVATEIERQLHGTPAATVAQPPAPAPSSTSSASEPREGIRSFFDGALRGDYSGNASWLATAGQVAMGFVPIAGQIADVRDLSAAVKNWRSGEGSGWGVLAAGIGFLPGGDAVKGAIRGGGKVADAAGEVAGQVAKRSDPELIAKHPLLTSAPGAHAVTRHGGAVTDDHLMARARTGLTPDGKKTTVPPTISSAFHSDALLVTTDKAIRENGALATAIKASPNASQVTVRAEQVGDLGVDLGRGYERIGKDVSLQGPLRHITDLRSAEGRYVKNAAGQWETYTLYPTKVAP